MEREIGGGGGGGNRRGKEAYRGRERVKHHRWNISQIPS